MSDRTAAIPPTTWLQRFISHPMTRMFLPFTLILLAVGALQFIFALLGTGLGIAAQPVFILVSTIITVALVYAGYSFYIHNVEQRPVAELARPRAAREFGAGLVLGAGLFGLTILGIWLLGGYQFTDGIDALTAIASSLALAISSGFIEELIFRGIFFRHLEAMLGSWWALGITALFFGIAHGANPGATVISSLAIALEAGVLLGALYMLSRRLWLAIGMHLAWNFTQGGIFGVPVSGNDLPGLLVGHPRGAALLSGGVFGAEASVIAMIVCLGAGGLVLLWVQRAGGIVQHARRSKNAASQPAE